MKMAIFGNFTRFDFDSLIFSLKITQKYMYENSSDR